MENKVSQEERGVSIKKIGPLFMLEGEFVKHPMIARPLTGFKDEIPNGIAELYKHIEKQNLNWFNKYPNCCDTHIRLNKEYGWEKDAFDFTKSLAYNSIRYLVHCLEINLDKEDWFSNISEYYDYLDQNFGSPGWGRFIFESYAGHVIENITFDDVEFSDEKRMRLIDHMYPNAEILQDQSNNGDLGELYIAFQEWLNVMPSIGEMANLKERLTGKIPMNIFMKSYKYNRYTGLTRLSIKTVPELLNDLRDFTKTMLLTIQDSVESQFYEENRTMFALSEEKLRISQAKIFNDISKETLDLADYISRWLNMWVEYFQETIVSNKITGIDKAIKQNSLQVQKVFNSYDLLSFEVASLRRDVFKFYNDNNIKDRDKYKNEIVSLSEDVDEIDGEASQSLYDKIAGKIFERKSSYVELADKMKSSGLTLKSRIKISIPILLFTYFESEMEVSAKDKIPTNLSQLRDLLVE